MVGDATVHVLDPGETTFRPTVFLQGLKKRKAALACGGARAPRLVPVQRAPGPLGCRPLAFVEAEGQIILRVQCPAARLERPAPEGWVPVGCAPSSPSGASLQETSLCLSGYRLMTDSPTVGTELSLVMSLAGIWDLSYPRIPQGDMVPGPEVGGPWAVCLLYRNVFFTH